MIDIEHSTEAFYLLVEASRQEQIVSMHLSAAQATKTRAIEIARSLDLTEEQIQEAIDFGVGKA